MEKKKWRGIETNKTEKEEEIQNENEFTPFLNRNHCLKKTRSKIKALSDQFFSLLFAIHAFILRLLIQCTVCATVVWWVQLFKQQYNPSSLFIWIIIVNDYIQKVKKGRSIESLYTVSTLKILWTYDDVTCKFAG